MNKKNEKDLEQEESSQEQNEQTAQEAAVSSGTTQELSFEDLQKERDEYLEGWKRMRADYENLCKEQDRLKKEYMSWSTERILSSLLPALDQYEIAMSFIPDLSSVEEAKRKELQNWVIGLQAVRSLWWDAAKELGLEKISADGAFNDELHEAVGEEESETVPEGHIIKTTMNGYSLQGKPIRFAKVVVSSGKK